MYPLLVIFSCLWASAWSHVALKYPPARKYDLDFLDSFRTVGSCGMNPGTERTQLVAGDQATEWGQTYQFRSCSEISLVAADQVTAPACSGHGRQQSARCTCDKGFAGDLCQYQTECDTDADCGQVEVVAEFASQSWVGLGWRPADSTKTCQKFPEDAPAPRGNDFHAMDCTDMVIGFAKGGEDDLLSGDVWKQDGNTVMRFTKKLAAGTADHAFQGRLHLIWATGQTQDEFYKNDQLKYHGRQQRGIYVIDGPVSEALTSSIQLHPAIIGVIVACCLLAFIMFVQIIMKLTRQS